jgi:hypothetical protein
MGSEVLNRLRKIGKWALLIAAPALLMACEAAPLKKSQDNVPALPLGAIHVIDNLYMVPIGDKKPPCTVYRAHATDGAAVAALFYRTTDGTFVMDKSKSACPD